MLHKYIMGYGKTTRYLSLFEFGTEHVGKPTIQWLIINVSCENGEATSEKKTVNIRIPQGRKRAHTHTRTISKVSGTTIKRPLLSTWLMIGCPS